MNNLIEKKIQEIHIYFKGQEKEVIHDFENCLKKRYREESSFFVAYEKAANDLGNEEEVPEAYDKSTIGWIKDCMPFISEKIFSKEVVAV